MIEIINVSKRFRIWEDRSRDLKETTINFLRGKKRSFRDVWALRGIELKIDEGETVAFIGQNGSGKSTLLKLLAGIYVPDKGKIVTQGKISTLLELGIGFHPDLTGEENIYLNGAMLGFDRKEMEGRFNEIVSFSEIGDFVYSPIRTYSSGMLMRLGFSIATCVDPDILLVDEILAVGDEAFQEKCLERMERFKETRKTIVLVSHSMEMVLKFCERAILLHEGRVVSDDVPERTVDAYHRVLYGHKSTTLEKDLGADEGNYEASDSAAILSQDQEESRKGVEVSQATATENTPAHVLEEIIQALETKSIPGQIIKEVIQITEPENIPDQVLEPEAPDPTHYKRQGALEAEIVEVAITSERGEEAEAFVSGEKITVRLRIRCHQDMENPAVGMIITRFDSGCRIIVYNTNTLWRNIRLGLLRRDMEFEVRFIQQNSLPEGEYYLNVGIGSKDGSTLYDYHENLKSFQVRGRDLQWEGMIDLNSQIVISAPFPLNRSADKRMGM